MTGNEESGGKDLDIADEIMTKCAADEKKPNATWKMHLFLLRRSIAKAIEAAREEGRAEERKRYEKLVEAATHLSTHYRIVHGSMVHLGAGPMLFKKLDEVLLSLSPDPTKTGAPR